MKLGKIGSICRKEKKLRVLTADGEMGNLVMQWVGTDRALYAVKGVTLKARMLISVWDMEAKEASMDVAEGSYEDMVRRGLLGAEDAQTLRTVPELVDEEGRPNIALGEVNGYVAMAAWKDGIVYLPVGYLEPCGGRSCSMKYILMPGNGIWIAAYERGALVAMLRAEEPMTSIALQKTVQAMAQRELVEG
ncbi:MAG: hypothetical protein ACI4MJ_01155 [Aristaeellaceae bacterium]